MKKIIFIFLITIWSIVFPNPNLSHSWCGTTQLQERDFERFEYLYPQFIDSTHFRVHFTTEPADEPSRRLSSAAVEVIFVPPISSVVA